MIYILIFLIAVVILTLIVLVALANRMMGQEESIGFLHRRLVDFEHLNAFDIISAIEAKYEADALMKAVKRNTLRKHRSPVKLPKNFGMVKADVGKAELIRLKNRNKMRAYRAKKRGTKTK